MLAPFLLLAVALGPADWVREMGGTVELGRQGQVVAVDLSRTWVNDSDLQRLGTFADVERLDLSHTRITDLGFLHLKQLRKVTSVNLYYAEQLGDGACAVMKAWPRLRELNMRGTKVTDTGVAHLAGHAELSRIDVGFALFTDNGVEQFTTMPKLRSIAMGGNKMTDVGLGPLKRVANLMELDLGGLQRTDSGLWQVTVTDRGLETLGSLKSLVRLNLRNAKITDAGVESLFGLTNLMELNLMNTGLSPEALARVQQALPKARLLSGSVDQARR